MQEILGQEWHVRSAAGQEGQLFVFYPPPEYNLFKYLHDLLLKGFPFFIVLLWFIMKLGMEKRERFVTVPSSTLLKKICFLYTLRNIIMFSNHFK